MAASGEADPRAAGRAAVVEIARSLMEPEGRRTALSPEAVTALLEGVRSELNAPGSVAAKDVARALEQLEDVMDAVFLLGDASS